MKKLTSYLLLLVYLPVSFNFFLPLAAYKLNQKLIAEKLCENRDKPELMCNGKCYLVKQMERQAEAKKDSDNKIIITSIYEMSHLMVGDNKSFNHFPRVFLLYSYYKNPVNLFLDVSTPPPKPGSALI